MNYTINQIEDVTAFNHGDLFESENQVREYFTAENLEDMFGTECEHSQEELSEMAELVIANKSHCNF